MSFIFIHIFTISRTCLQVSIWQHFLQASRTTFNFSLSVGLLATHFFSLCFSNKVFTMPFFKQIFVLDIEIQVAGCFLQCTVLPCCRLTCTFSEKSAVILILFPCLPRSAVQTLEHSQRLRKKFSGGCSSVFCLCLLQVFMSCLLTLCH